jgi:hypothetical protein
MPALLFAPLVLVFEPRDANTSNNGQGIIGIPRSLTRTKSLLKLWQACQGGRGESLFRAVVSCRECERVDERSRMIKVQFADCPEASTTGFGKLSVSRPRRQGFGDDRSEKTSGRPLPASEPTGIS